MKTRRSLRGILLLVMTVSCFAIGLISAVWIGIMLFNVPLSQLYGRKAVDHAVDVLFFVIEGSLLVTLIAPAMILALWAAYQRKLHPEGAHAWTHRGRIKMRKGDLPGAVDDFTRALEVDPDFSNAYLTRALTKSRLGDFTGALADLDRARETGAPWFTVMLLRRLTKLRLKVRIPRVAVGAATLNDQPIRLALDTGSSFTCLTRITARRLALKSNIVSHVHVNASRGLLSLTAEPARVTLGTQTLDAPLPVLNISRFFTLSGFDGLLGWPEVRDNILVFDGAQRTITAIAELPAETANWLKLKIHPDQQLVLELPLLDGTVGTLLVDTGAGHGLALPRTRLKAWRAAHPQALRTSFRRKVFGRQIMPGTRSFDASEVWADEIELGPLTLTDIPLRNANYVEANRRHKNRLGSIGMYALTRMDLVVDGKNGFAYVKPKSPPGPAYARLPRPGIAPVPVEDWSLAGEVALRPTHLLAFGCVSQAMKKMRQNAYAGALADCDRALELEPDSFPAYFARGRIKDKQNDTAGAIADFTRALEIDPRQPGAYLLRGVARAELDDEQGAREDYQRARELGVRKMRIRFVQLLIRFLHSRLGRQGNFKATTKSGNLEGAILRFSLVVAGGGSLLLLLQKLTPGPAFPEITWSNFILFLILIMVVLPIGRAFLASYFDSWPEDGGDAGGGLSHLELVREWTNEMLFVSIYSLMMLDKLPLPGPLTAWCFYAMGFLLTCNWYFIARRLQRPPPLRIMQSKPKLVLWLFGLVLIIAWMLVIFFVGSAALGI